MKKNVTLSSFLNISLKFLFLLILVESIVHRNLYYKFSITSLMLSIIAISLVIFVYFYLKKNYSKKLLFIILLSVGLIFRVLWFLNLDSIPIGDFNRMFICAGEFLTGSNYMFRGTSYFARFPHMTATVLYFAIIRNFFSNPLIAIRIINIILSMFNIILLYMISKEIFKDEKKSFWVLLISALYPPMILYSNVYCSENLAMPLLLLSVLMFFKSINNKQNLLYLCLSGIFLSLSHLFRPNGYVFIIAYIMYLFLYFKENITVKLKNILVVLVSFIVPFVLFSTLLIKLNITEYPLWHGTEPPSISMLKGTNIASGGKWNEEDFKVFHDCDENYEKADKKAKEIIKERLINTPKLELAKFYVSKFSNFWNNGSFAGDYWSEAGLDEAYNINFDTLLNDQGDFFWQLDTLALEHIDKLKEGGIYIHSNAVPLGDFDPNFKPFVKNFEDNDIKFNIVKCTGHARPLDLIKIINLIKPKLLIPIHSYRPEKLYNENGDVLLPKKGQTI